MHGTRIPERVLPSRADGGPRARLYLLQDLNELNEELRRNEASPQRRYESTVHRSPSYNHEPYHLRFATARKG